MTPLPIRFLLIAEALFLQACSSLPPQVEREPSMAFSEPEQTYLGQTLAPASVAHPGHSGFRLLDTGQEALQSRIALAALAERSIDAQYFVWNADVAGRLLASALVEAADRGVRVRVLVDAFYIGGRDARIAAFNRHPNIQVRVFNPVATRRTKLSRLLGFVANFSRLNHRMHNKLFLVDGSFGVAGGRNVGDEYFGIDPEFNFRDRDVLAAGPVVAALGASFDEFWNGDWSIPFEVLLQRQPSPSDSEALFRELAQFTRDQVRLPYPIQFSRAALEKTLDEVIANLIWAEVDVHYDLPDDSPSGSESGFERVRRALVDLIGAAECELLVQTPYLIPRYRAIEMIGDVIRAGVDVRFSTNSLASTDMVPAQAIYANHRPEMIAQGARIFELRPDAAIRSRYSLPNTLPEATLGLHAKTIVVDRQVLYIGTFNLDQRSALLNTEIALIIHSPILAEEVARYIETDMRPQNSWEVVAAETGGSVWIERSGNHVVRYTRPPQASLGRRMKAGVMSLLPIEEQL